MTLYSDLNYIKPSIGDRVYDIDSVFQSIFSIIGTKKGERVFRPAFGMNLTSYLFEPCDEITARSILYDISNTMEQEPRVSFNTSKSSVIPVPSEKLFIITIVFNILGFSNTEKSLNLVLKQKDR
jgi:phage baseplate assembly protein W